MKETADRAEKLAGWNKLKVDSWARYFASHVALTLLVVLLQLQTNVTAARLLLKSRTKAAAENGNGAQGNGHRSAPHYTDDAQDQQHFVELVRQFCGVGLEHLVRDLLPMVESVVASCGLGGEKGSGRALAH